MYPKFAREDIRQTSFFMMSTVESCKIFSGPGTEKGDSFHSTIHLIIEFATISKIQVYSAGINRHCTCYYYQYGAFVGQALSEVCSSITLGSAVIHILSSSVGHNLWSFRTFHLRIPVVMCYGEDEKQYRESEKGVPSF
uniref:Uncharacterized protein n=1 Tax=Parascaris univalens TaxID=6257 RepID=A0A915B5C9_PARUN